jgi:hypothetical protein
MKDVPFGVPMHASARRSILNFLPNWRSSAVGSSRVNSPDEIASGPSLSHGQERLLHHFDVGAELQ